MAKHAKLNIKKMLKYFTVDEFRFIKMTSLPFFLHCTRYVLCTTEYNPKTQPLIIKFALKPFHSPMVVKVRKRPEFCLNNE